jgi:hypothetical protein
MMLVCGRHPQLRRIEGMMMDKPRLAAAFEGKVLGVRNYRSEKHEFLVTDFLDLRTLQLFLTEVSTGESDITPAGKTFLDRYYGFEAVAFEFSSKGDFALGSEASTFEEILEWLKALQPMHTVTFIEEARGNLKPGASLRQDFLPPEDI